MKTHFSGTQPNSRVRGRKLQRIRERHFYKFPLCVECEKRGLIRAATQLDHIVALTNGGADVEENRQGLCDDCHAVKTRIDLGHKERPEIGLDGWPKNPTTGPKNPTTGGRGASNRLKR